ncbi:MAG TPA: NBR1-Ig-like domain-containing protein, partial [Anaerolineales bacterium]|nr:NBR1-Ig-like domain-containing protein [Anaerolineales bacterium]
IFLVSFFPTQTVLAATDLPPADLFQLPWDQGLSWMAIDGLDNGTKRPLDSSHQYTVGGAIDFAPRKDMKVGENTSNFWITAAATGTVIEKSFCHLKINHGNGWVTEYQFLANVQVKSGDIVYRNQRLGVIANGTTQKFCPGSKEINIPHLHFMLRPTLRNATFAGWQVGYVPLLNKTSFAKNGETLGLNQLLLNALDLQIVLRGPITWDTIYTGSVDTSRYERWSFALTETTKFTLTGTAATTGFVPLVVLLDSSGNEIARGTNTLTSTQPAGSYFVQIQPQTANGFYGLTLHREDLPVPTDPYASVVVNPASIKVGETAVATVSLNNVPAEGYTSAEFTCTYNPNIVEASSITATSLFGADPAVAISGPQNGSFIIAVAGSNGNKATTGGTLFSFNAKGLAAGQSPIECAARVSKGDSVLTSIESLSASLTVGASSEPTATPTATLAPVTPTTSPASCDKAELVSDVTLPAGTVLLPGSNVTKTWRIRNAGTCTWTPSYGWTFVSGDLMDAPLSNTFAYDILPGETFDLYVSFFVPYTSGHYQSFWKLHNASGALFGTGSSASDPFVLDIVASGPTVTPSATAGPTETPPQWRNFRNSKYGFEFLYPNEAQLLSGSTDNYARINLPFTPGTNLSEKYLDVTVVENVSSCHSPLATSSMLETSETVVINGITFLKETGQDGTAGHTNKWTAYSTSRDNACVSLSFVLRAVNPGVFTTPIPLYDEAAETSIFGQIVSTYAWLALVPTTTPTFTATPEGPTATFTPTATITPTTTPPAVTGSLAGKVLAGKLVTVTLLNADSSVAASGTVNVDGSFGFTVAPGTYTLRATADGFLSAQTSITLTAGSVESLPMMTLLAGDIDNNNVIDQFDAMTIGMNYNSAVPAAADLNNDGTINVLDLELLARNYRVTGPVAWED